MKILVVEDDRSYRALLYEFLHSHDHEVLAVSDALHAMALLNEADNGIELVLLDMRMPRMGGDTVMDTYASWNRCQTHFLVMSGEAEYMRYSNHPMVVGCLQKPFSFQTIESIIDRLGTNSAVPA